MSRRMMPPLPVSPLDRSRRPNSSPSRTEQRRAVADELRSHRQSLLAMATFALIHGAGDVGWYWHLIERELRERGHDVVAPDLPCDDDSANLWDYADTVAKAVGDRRELAVVAQSAGAFTAPLVCTRVPVEILVLVAGLVTKPGEAPGEWWTNTGYEPVRGAWSGDVHETF